MTTFDEREQAFENKFKHDQELLFRIYARRAKLFGLWTAQQLGLSGEEATAYGQEMVRVDFEEPGHHDIIRKALADLTAKGLDWNERRLEKEAERLLDDARQQIMEA